MSSAIGIDFGTGSILIHLKNKGIVIREPSVAAIDLETGKIAALGTQAELMIGRTPGSYRAFSPISEGVISDFEISKLMLRSYIQKLCRFRLIRPDMIFSVPSCISSLEERALVDAALYAGARQVYLVESVLASAIGAGINFSGPEGRAVIDIGAGTCNIGILSLGSVVESLTIKTGGKTFDEDIKRYFRKNKDLIISDKDAESIKIKLGALSSRPNRIEMKLNGRNIKENIISEYTVSSDELNGIFSDSADTIIEGIGKVFEKIPTELLLDIKSSGITLTGGGSLFWGLDSYIEHETGINVHICDDSISCTVLGLAKLSCNLKRLASGVINLDRNKRLNII